MSQSPERKREYAREWKARNPDRHLGNSRRFVQRRWRRVKAGALERLGNRCAACGSGERLELDHIEPQRGSRELATGAWIRAAAGDTSNLQLLCHSCHVDKTKGE